MADNLNKAIGLALFGVFSVGSLSAQGMFAKLLSANYLPHRYCYLTQPWLVWTNVTMDALIGASYVAIFGSLLWILFRLHKKPELRGYLWIFVSFGSFILACSMTHMMEIVTVWWPLYPLSAAFKGLCAVVSVPTAVVMARRSPQIVTNLCVYLDALQLSQRQQEDLKANYKGQMEALERSQMMIEFAMDGSILLANENYLRAFGYTRAELEGKKHSIFVPEAELKSAEYQQFWKNLRNGQYQMGRFRRTGKGGREVWVEASYNPILDSDGAVGRIVEFASDVTERMENREALLALRKSEDFLERTGRLAGVGGWEVDLVTNAVSWSSETYRILGADLSYQPTLEEGINLYTPESRPIITAAIAKACTDGVGWDLELSLISCDGRHLWARSVGAVERLDGNPVRLRGAFQDVTLRVAERLALEIANTRAALATESGGIGIWDWDIVGNTFTCDTLMYLLYGLEPEVDSRYGFEFWARHVHPEDRLFTEPALQEAIDGGTPFDREFRIVWDDGSVRHLRATAKVTRDAFGKAIRVVGTNCDITDRVAEGEALKKANTRAALATESGGIGIWDWDLKTGKVTCDDWMYRLCGLDPEAHRREDYDLWAGHVHPDDRVRVEKALQDGINETAPYDTEYRILWADGSLHFIRATGQVIRDSGGQPVRMVGTNAEVTARKLAEQEVLRERAALEAARERLILAAESSGTGIWDWHIEQNALVWDAQMYRIYGLTSPMKTEEPYALWVSHVHPEDRGFAEQALQECIQENKPFNLEFRIVWDNGSTHHIKATGKVTFDKDGKALRIVGTNSDITKHKEAENALRDQASLLDLSHDGIMLRDLSGRIKFWNHGAEQMYGYSKEQALGRISYELLQTVFPLPLQEIDEGLQKTGQWYGELDHTHQDGRRIVVASRWVLQGGRSGENFSVMEVESDITGRRQAEEALLKATRVAEHANQAKSEFLANMSHEIRTPMTAIMGMTYLALAANPDPKQRVYLTKISNAADSLIAIINDILDFSKIEAGKMELEQIPFLLEGVLESVRDITIQKAHEKGLALLFPLVEDKTQYLLGDSGRLVQVLINLVNNAVKFTASGSVVIKAFVEETSGDSMRVSFSVSDAGIGMSAAQVDKLFRSFEQADTSMTRKFGGTGLGLAISKQLCNLMGATLEVTSELGHGSTFSFTVVFKKALKPAALQRRLVPDSLKSKSVLVVDDSEHARDVVVSMLRANGFRAEFARGGKEAITLLTSASEAGQPFDIAIIDWNMPGRSGVEIAREIKIRPQLSQNLAIVMISAFDRDEVLADLDGLKLQGLLIKPVSELVLLQALANIYGIEATDSGAAPGVSSEINRGALVGRRVLLVEDNEIIVDLSTALLEHLGILVTLAVNGRQAVDQVTKEPFDLVLMDIQMPVMDGLSATKLIRADSRFRNLPIIAMTAQAMRGDRERSIAAGMNEHLTKPINPKLLEEVLLRYMPVQRPPTEKPEPAPDKFAPSRSGLQTDLPEQLPPFDLDAALKQAMGNSGLLRKMLLRFFNQYAHAGAVLRAHIAEGKGEQAERLAHSLKGVAATLEARDLAAAAFQVEQALRTRQTADMDSLLDALEGALAPAIAAAGTLDSREASPGENAALARVPAKPRPRILVVDDNPIIIDLLVSIFVNDYEVLSATDGFEALRIAQSSFPELIMLDVMMPRMDGYEVCRRLLADPLTRSIPVIFVSGMGDTAAEAKGVSLGAVDYMTKPLNYSIVKARVDNQINLKRERESASRIAAEEHRLTLDAQIRRVAANQQSSREEMKLKDDFLSHVSHELRSPLASISSFSSIIADGLAGETTPEQKEYLAIIMRNVRQLRAMVEDLLDVTQVRTGKLRIELQCVDMRAAVLDAFHTLEGAAKAKQIHFHRQVPNGPASVYADPTRVVQILIVLLDNAIKFTPVGGEVRIEVGVFPVDPDYLLVEVSDTGCGIDPRKTESIFEHLYQVTETSQAGRKGLGLGLHIAKELVLRQGGKIWLTSTPAGSQFFFTLPIRAGRPNLNVDGTDGKEEMKGPKLLATDS